MLILLGVVVIHVIILLLIGWVGYVLWDTPRDQWLVPHPSVRWAEEQARRNAIREAHSLKLALCKERAANRAVQEAALRKADEEGTVRL
jgi:hypothetical protein